MIALAAGIVYSGFRTWSAGAGEQASSEEKKPKEVSNALLDAILLW